MKKNKFVWLAAAALAVLAWWFFNSPHHPRVDGATAQRLVQAGARLVDVRTTAEFQAKHIAGAINIPVQDLATRMKELEPKDRGIVVYCRSGHRSGMAYDQLKAAGFTQLADLGPMSAW